MDSVTLYLDDHPEVPYEDVQGIVAAILEASPDVPATYVGWGVDYFGGRVGEIVPGAMLAIDIHALPQPVLAILAATVQDALTTRLGVRSRLESEIPDIDREASRKRRLSAAFRERITDDLVFTPIGRTPPPPASVETLLGDLGLRHATDTETRDAVRAWLVDNEASPRLIGSLRRRGYGDLLDEVQR